MVKLIKLITGEEVIASITDGESITQLKNPARIAVMGDAARLIPFILFGKGESISIKNEHILFTTDVEDDVLNGYNSQFGSGIVLANSSNLIT